ncbi:unnamed protein product [Paramecium octaurelia]|uniref:Uncharacterized protein n=1 Tax=Paramecium octaurelia TaxID=43137 RepID=A0A8S1STL4_PAROT|nr:unnamed protein product [Paramecium octaurelia]
MASKSWAQMQKQHNNKLAIENNDEKSDYESPIHIDSLLKYLRCTE